MRAGAAPWAVAALLAVILVSGCSNSSDKAAEPFGGKLQYIAVDAPPEQRAAFEDGVITFQEYEQAVLKMANCLRQEGIAWEPKLDPSGKYYDNGVNIPAGPPEEVARKSAAIDRCEGQYVEATLTGWQMQNNPTQKELEDARKALAECLRNRGISVPENPVEQDFIPLKIGASPDFLACVQEIQARFGLRGFAG